MEILKRYKIKEKGYTLIELIIVLAIFSLVLTIALPNSKAFKTYNQNQQLRLLEKDLRQARNTAIIENRPIFIEFLIEKNAYVIKYSESNRIIERTLDNGVKFTTMNVSGNVNTVKFNPDGRPAHTGTVNIKKGSENYELVIAPVISKITIKRIS